MYLLLEDNQYPCMHSSRNVAKKKKLSGLYSISVSFAGYSTIDNDFVCNSIFGIPTFLLDNIMLVRSTTR